MNPTTVPARGSRDASRLLRRAALLAAIGCAPLAAQQQSPKQQSPVDPAAAGATQTPAAGQGKQGQEPAPSSRLPEVLVTESADSEQQRLDEVPLDYAGGRDRIGPRTTQSASGMNIQEVLRRSPGVHISEETGSDSLPNIALRGITNGSDGTWRSISLGMYADGIPLAPAPYGQPGNSLFPMTMERVYAIDVIRGGGAVRYGPNNVAGVVNFLTRPIPKEAMVLGRMRYDTFDNASYYMATGGTFGSFGMLLEGVYKQGDSFRDNGDYTLQNYALKTSYAVSDSVRLFGQVETFDDDTRLSDGLTLAAYQADPSQTLSPQNRFEGHQDRANLKLEWDVDDDTLFELITYAFDGERTFFLGSPTFYGTTPPAFIQATPRPMTTFAVQPQITHDYSLGDGTGELHVGMRYLEEDIKRGVVRYFPNGTEQLRTEEEYDYYTGSFWVENAFRWDAWTVTPGLRFEYVDMRGRENFNITTPALNGLNVQKDFTEVLPGLTASRQMTDQWALYAGAQRTFAAPQAPQISITNNPQDISAQYAWNYEVGSRARTDDKLIGSDFTLFWIDYSDRLVQDPNQFDVFVNAGSSRHRGAELALESDLGAAGIDGVTLWTSTAYVDSEFTNGQFDGNEFPGAPNWIHSWGVRYDHERTGLFCSIDGTHVEEAFTDAANTAAIPANGTAGIRPAYTLWNANVGWEAKLDAKNDVSVLIGGRNVFDEDYFEPRAARGIFPGAPASMVFQVGMTHRF